MYDVVLLQTWGNARQIGRLFISSVFGGRRMASRKRNSPCGGDSRKHGHRHILQRLPVAHNRLIFRTIRIIVTNLQRDDADA